jgi:hypothetical protein
MRLTPVVNGDMGLVVLCHEHSSGLTRHQSRRAWEGQIVLQELWHSGILPPPHDAEECALLAPYNSRRYDTFFVRLGDAATGAAGEACTAAR